MFPCCKYAESAARQPSRPGESTELCSNMAGRPAASSWFLVPAAGRPRRSTRGRLRPSALAPPQEPRPARRSTDAPCRRLPHCSHDNDCSCTNIIIKINVKDDFGKNKSQKHSCSPKIVVLRFAYGRRRDFLPDSLQQGARFLQEGDWRGIPVVNWVVMVTLLKFGACSHQRYFE